MPMFEHKQDYGLFAPPKSKVPDPAPFNFPLRHVWQVANLKHKDFVQLNKIEIKAALYEGGPAMFDGDALLKQKHVRPNRS